MWKSARKGAGGPRYGSYCQRGAWPGPHGPVCIEFPVKIGGETVSSFVGGAAKGVWASFDERNRAGCPVFWINNDRPMQNAIRKPALRIALFALVLACGCGGQENASESAEPEPDAAIRIVFLGDSITEAGASPGGYVTLVDEALQARYPGGKVEVIGAGISGNKVPDLQERLDRDVLAYHPTHVAIYIGINDVWHSYAFDHVTGTDRDVFEAGLRDLISTMHAANVHVSLCTPSVIGEDPASEEEVNQALMDYADISRAVAEASGAVLCDLRAAFEERLAASNPDKLYEGVLTTDGVHLNEAGNRFVADLMLEHFERLLEQ